MMGDSWGWGTLVECKPKHRPGAPAFPVQDEIMAAGDPSQYLVGALKNGLGGRRALIRHFEDLRVHLDTTKDKHKAMPHHDG